jgi:hypothetical protein
MAARVRRRPPATRTRAAAPRETTYRKGRAFVGLAVLVFLFAFIWIVNGAWTAAFVSTTWRTTMDTGWSVHLVVSAFEMTGAYVRPWLVGLPQWVYIIIVAISLPLGVLDCLSSAVGIAPWLVWTGATGVVAHFQNTLAALLVGFLPEPMIVMLLVAIWRIYRS